MNDQLTKEMERINALYRAKPLYEALIMSAAKLSDDGTYIEASIPDDGKVRHSVGGWASLLTICDRAGIPPIS